MVPLSHLPRYNPPRRPGRPEKKPPPPLRLVEGGLAGAPTSAPALPFLLPLLRRVMRVLPSGLPTWIYTTLLRPAPLRCLANSLLLRAIPGHVQTNGVLVVLNPKDPVVSSALSLGIYERYETKLVGEYVTPGMRVLDIGANVGYYTALLAKQVGPAGHVTAFEPEPGNFQVLCRTVGANDFQNVQTIQGAVSDAPGESLLFLSEENQGDHRLYATQGRGSIAVPLVSVDTCLPADVPLDFVKMDIQGSEGKALRGMQETLRRSPNVRILTEFWPEGLSQAGTDPLEFLEMLQDTLGFSLLEVDEKREQLVPVRNLPALIARHPGRAYANLLCKRDTGVREEN